MTVGSRHEFGEHLACPPGAGDIKEILGVASAIVWFERDLPEEETYPQRTNPRCPLNPYFFRPVMCHPLVTHRSQLGWGRGLLPDGAWFRNCHNSRFSRFLGKALHERE